MPFIEVVDAWRSLSDSERRVWESKAQAAQDASRDEFHRKAMVVYREKDHEHPGFRHSIKVRWALSLRLPSPGGR